MQIIQNRRDFLASAVVGRQPRACSAPSDRSLPRGRRRRPRSACHSRPGICFAPLDVAEEFLRAEGFTDVRYVRAAGGFSAPQMIAQRRGGLRLRLRRHGRLSPGCRPADHRARRRARRLLRAVRARADPQHRRPEGPTRGHPDAQLERPSVPLDHGDARRARPAGGHRVGGAAVRQRRWSCSPKARPTPSSAFRPSRRSCAPAASAA